MNNNNTTTYIKGTNMTTLAHESTTKRLAYELREAKERMEEAEAMANETEQHIVFLADKTLRAAAAAYHNHINHKA